MTKNLIFGCGLVWRQKIGKKFLSVSNYAQPPKLGSRTCVACLIWAHSSLWLAPRSLDPKTSVTGPNTQHTEPGFLTPPADSQTFWLAQRLFWLLASPLNSQPNKSSNFYSHPVGRWIDKWSRAFVLLKIFWSKKTRLNITIIFK